ncbi:hypothetical protein Tco_1433005, partial [Tanacetum coccineum]
SIPCSPKCNIVGLILLDHCLSHALTATADVPAVDTLHLPVETPENPFVAPANIHTIEAFMNRVGYQGVVDKVSAFYTKNLAQPWQTMLKVFNRCLSTRTSGHDQTKINILQLFHIVLNQTHVDYAALLWWDFMNNVFQKKEVIQYPRFIKLIVADMMKKSPNIPKNHEEDYHSIKDDVPLVSVYTTGNVLVRGMLIMDALLTAEIRETDDFKECKTVFMKVNVPMNQSQPVKRKQIAGESSSPQKSLKITIKQKKIVEKDDDDSEDRIELESHKDNPEVVNDDDDKEREQKDDEMGSLEIRNEEMQTTIPTPLSSPRKILSSNKKTFQELTDIVSNPDTSTSKHSQVKKRISRIYSHLPRALRRMCRRQCYMIQDMERKCVTIAKLWETHNKIDDILHEMKRNLQDRADDIALWEALRHEFEKSSISNTSCREDDFHSHHAEHQDDDAPPKGEKRVKRSKMSKRSKSARDSLSKHSRKDSTTYNVDKRVPTIFDHARMEATLRDSLSNLSRNVEEYVYHLEQSTRYSTMEIPRKRSIFGHSTRFMQKFPEPDLEEKLNR